MEGVRTRISKRLHSIRHSGDKRIFGNARRGESVELAVDLNSNDRDRQRNAVKRIIANMTLGRDVSQLFVDVVKLSRTVNIELKKLVYLYILNTAKLQPEKALMAVNTFLQDAAHQSPVIRALAIRTMLCVRVDGVTEHAVEPLRRATRDIEAYVRKTAALGIGKLFHYSARTFLQSKLLEDLYRLLEDTYPTVASNAAAVLSEIHSATSLTTLSTSLNAAALNPILIKHEVAQRLLKLMQEASEWEQVYLMDLLALYTPPNAREAQSLAERLYPRLGHRSPVVVLAAIKLIALQVSRVDPNWLNSPIQRITTAVVSLLKWDEQSDYVVLRNVPLLLTIFPHFLAGNLESFFVRFQDPLYIKCEKIRVLLLLTTSTTAGQVLREFRECTTDLDLTFLRCVVEAIAHAAIKADTIAGDCVKLLLQVATRNPSVLPEVLVAAKDISRAYPHLLPLQQLIDDHGAENVEREEAKVAFSWMLGEFCDEVKGGFEILQSMIGNILLHEPAVQLALLTAVVKVFLRQPRQLEPMLNSILEVLTNNSPYPDIRDRAYAYWRMLFKGIGVARMKKIVHGQRPPCAVDVTFTEIVSPQDVIRSVNTAAALYWQLSRTFVPRYGFETRDDEEESSEEEPVGEDAVTTLSDVVHASAASAPPQRVDPNLGVDDLFGRNDVAPEQPLSTSDTGRAANALDDLFNPVSEAPPSTSFFLPPSAAPPIDGAKDPLVLAESIVSPSHRVHADENVTLFGVLDADALSLTMVISSHCAEPLAEVELQLNCNAMGLVPTAPFAGLLRPTQFVPPMEKVIGVLPLRVTEKHFKVPSQSEHYGDVEVALKHSRGLVRFFVPAAVPTAGAAVFAEGKPLEQDVFARQWRGMEEGLEQKALLGPMAAYLTKVPTNEVVTEVFSRGRLYVTAVRARELQTVFYGSCTLRLGFAVLFEVIAYRQTPSMSQLSVKSPRAAEVLPLVSHAMSKCLATLAPASSSSGVPSVLSDDFFA